ncbi:DUF222 domain-containing protein [Kribbella sp. NPDC023855]|uniref:HNH endonuclease signature motif containing protein n=1 Tax=Kribbella sp. NPDC023855 TaxID=3154698 RepID=UPI0033D125A7
METTQLLPPSRLSDSALLSTLDAVDAALSTLNTYHLQLLADFDQRGLATEQGARDTIEFISLRHNRNRREIRRDLKTTKALSKYSAVTAALPDPTAPTDSGAVPGAARLSPAQAEAIVTTLEKAPASVPDEALRVAEEQMIEVARLLTPDDLRGFGREVLARLDTDGPEPAENDAHARETLTLRRADGGVKFTGYLAGENAEQFRTQINRLSKPHRTLDGELDPRPHDKRQADALTQILNLAAGNTPRAGDEVTASNGPGLPHITITIDFDDLRNATSHAVGELVYGDNLSASAVRRLACDAAILPIVLGSDSQPLDVGTEQRFVTRPIRRALMKRDKGCVICKAPPWQCHAHHLIHWIDGGPTSITNLVLLCPGHHRAVHSGHWTITITGGMVQVTRPMWTTPGTTGADDLASLIDLTRYFTPATGGPVSVNPQYEHRDGFPASSLTRHSALTGQLSPQTSPQASPNPSPQTSSKPSAQTSPQPGSGALPWLTSEAVGLLDPWGDSGTPSAGP